MNDLEDRYIYLNKTLNVGKTLKTFEKSINAINSTIVQSVNKTRFQLSKICAFSRHPVSTESQSQTKCDV